jgi:hypothetical protein
MRHQLVALVVLAACGSSSNDPAPDAAPCTPAATGAAPTYTELYAKYFAPNTPGHCATAGCHADPGATTWSCGTSKDACYAGMVGVGLIDPGSPTRSRIADPRTSPLSWINPSGGMPQDAAAPLPAGRDAILAWVAACAPNN